MKLFANLAWFLLLLLVFMATIDSDQLISVVLQRCYSMCNKKYCNISIRCRPINRTSKLVSMDFYFNSGVTLKAPINIEIIAYKKFRTEHRQHMVKLKTELCSQLNSVDHPYFRVVSGYWKSALKGNMFDPCPFSGHRYLKPYISSHGHVPLVPVGEWRLDFTFSKNINNSDVFLASWSDFYEVKPTGAEEF